MQPPDFPLDVALLDRYFAGHCSAEEEAQIRALRAASPHADALIESLRAVQGRDAAVHAVRAPADMWEQFRATVMHPVPRPTSRNRLRPFADRPPVHAPWSKRLRVAISAAATACLAVVLWRNAHPSEARVMVSREYVTTSGQVATLHIDSGTTIALAPESRLRIVTRTDGSRTVDLQGEGRFAVQASARAPFVVQTGGVTTRVLGTVFDVRHYSGDPAVRVTVIDGRVSSHGPRAAITLARGMTALVSDSTVTTDASATLMTGRWSDGQLVFTNAAVGDVLHDVERWCGCRFAVADSGVAERRITTTLTVTEPAETIAALEDLLDVSITGDGHVLTVRHRTGFGSRSRTTGRGARQSLFPQSEKGK